MADRIQTFRKVRARFLRTDEGRWLAGWTKHLDHDEARIRLKVFTIFEPGCCVVGECYGDGAVVRFSGRVTGQMGQDVAIRIVGPLGFEKSREAIRIGVEGISGLLWDESRSFDLLVTDVSPDSLGGLAGAAAPFGTKLGLAINLGGETIECTVGVVNCRPEPTEPGTHRMGLRILDASRLDAARWTRFVEASTLA